MRKIGLTGNFGMGKTTVLEMFNNMGAYTVNIDDLVHDILKKQSIVKKIVQTCGDDILADNSSKLSINKKHMAEAIFNNTEMRKTVEQIIHPEVLNSIGKIEAKLVRKDPPSIIVFEVPLLFEAGYKKHFDKTIVVYAKQNTALRRLLKKGFSRDEALKRLKAQMPITKKKKMSDFSIDNDSDLEITEKKVNRIFNKITAR
jgi:dephospho-CoA kinase